MKNAKHFEKQLRALLKDAKKASKPDAVEPEGLMTLMIEAVLSADATKKDLEKALSVIRREYVDYNELRVSMPKEIVEYLGRDYPAIGAKVHVLLTALNNVFNRQNQMTLAYLAEIPKREQRRHLKELGLCTYSEAYVTLYGLQQEAVPVDQTLHEILIMNEMIHEDTDIEESQRVLEKLTAQGKALSVHEFMRTYVLRNAKALAKKREEEAEAARQAREEAEAARKAAEEEAARKAAEEEAARQAKEEEAARKAAEKEAAKKAKEEAKAKAAEEKAARKAAREKAAKEKAAAKKKAAKKKTAKTSAKKAVKKTAKKKVAKKKATKKTAKKTTKKKAAKKVAKKPAAKKTVKKTVKKAAKKTAKKKTAKK